MTSTISRIDSNVVSSKLADEIVMMDLASGDYYGLNGIGSIIWDSIENPARVDFLVRKLSDEFQVEENVCKKDVLDFLNHLIENNLAKIDIQ